MVNDQEHLADIGPMLHIVMLSPALSSQKVSCPILPTGKEQKIIIIIIIIITII